MSFFWLLSLSLHLQWIGNEEKGRKPVQKSLTSNSRQQQRSLTTARRRCWSEMPVILFIFIHFFAIALACKCLSWAELSIVCIWRSWKFIVRQEPAVDGRPYLFERNSLKYGLVPPPSLSSWLYLPTTLTLQKKKMWKDKVGQLSAGRHTYTELRPRSFKENGPVPDWNI